MLDGSTPENVGRQLIAGIKLNDPNFRKSLIEGGEEAVRNLVNAEDRDGRFLR